MVEWNCTKSVGVDHDGNGVLRAGAVAVNGICQHNALRHPPLAGKVRSLDKVGQLLSNRSGIVAPPSATMIESEHADAVFAVLDAASTKEHGTSTDRSVILLVSTFRAVNPTAAIILFAGTKEHAACTAAAATTTGVVVVPLALALQVGGDEDGRRNHGTTDEANNSLDNTTVAKFMVSFLAQSSNVKQGEKVKTVKEARLEKLPGWAAVAAILSGFLAARPGQFRNVLWLSGAAVFQSDPFATIPLPRTKTPLTASNDDALSGSSSRDSGGGGGGEKGSGGSKGESGVVGISVFMTDTYPSMLTSVDPNVALLLGWLGVCQGHDVSLLMDAEQKAVDKESPPRGPSVFRGPGLVNTAAFIGSAAAIEVVLVEIVHAHTHNIDPKYWPVCGPSQIFSRLVWKKILAERIPVMIASVSSSPVVNLAAGDATVWREQDGVVVNARGDAAAIVLTPGLCVCCGAGLGLLAEDPAVCLTAVRNLCDATHTLPINANGKIGCS